MGMNEAKVLKNKPFPTGRKVGNVVEGNWWVRSEMLLQTH